MSDPLPPSTAGLPPRTPETAPLWSVLETVLDPEVPALSVVDLGIIRDASIANGVVEVVITPTYSGCPAMHMIEANVKSALHAAGYEQVAIRTVLLPAWTTDWMTERGKTRLKEYGIAPPTGLAAEQLVAIGGKRPVVPCPFCDSRNTELKSQFGATACKAFYFCRSCQQPFEHFKPF